MKQKNELHNCLLSNFCNLISVRLDNSNYVTWKFLLETMLKGCGLLRYVDGSFPCPPQHMIREEDGVTSEMTQQYMNWEQNDSAVMSILAATLSSDALSFVVGCKTSRELWCLLKERYASISRSNRMRLKTIFQNLQKGSDSIDKYLLRVKIACDQLANVGVHMPDEDIIVTVLHGLPSEFAVMKTIIKTKKSLVSMQELRSLLLIAEDEIELAAKSTSFLSNQAMTTYGDNPRAVASSNVVRGVTENAGAALSSSCVTLSSSMKEKELASFPSGRAFSPSIVSRMQWRPGSSFPNQNEAALFCGRTDIVSDQRKRFLQRLQQVQQQGQCAIVSLPTLVGGNSKEFSVQQQASGQDFENFEKNFEMSFEKESLVSDLVDKKREDSVGTEVSHAEIQKFIQETKSVNEADCKEGIVDFIFTVLGKETESKNLFDVKKKQLVEEVTTTLAPANTTKNDERRIGYLGLQSGTKAAAPQLSIPTLPAPFISNNPSMTSTTSFGFSNHKTSLSATQVSSNLSEWQQVMFKKIEALLPQNTWQLPSTPLDSTSLHCRQASHSMKLCQSLPLINPG
ncbi:hypothetical protein M0R45_001321 [Rubus argutus]|uniref:Uncharacterized protein n=1 Tax=Rubus argutus TaxID=59490 RepID=A0AAW1VI39_RUBAR